MLPETARACAQSPWLWAVPGVGAFCGTATIAAVYYMAASGGHLPVGSTTPPISFLGLQEPDARAASILFCRRVSEDEASVKHGAQLHWDGWKFDAS